MLIGRELRLSIIFLFFTFLIAFCFYSDCYATSGILNGDADQSAGLVNPINIKFRASFGHCPTRLINNLTLSLVDEFQKKFSLLDLKKRILDEGLQKKNYLSSYQINYDPLSQMLEFTYQCPLPLAGVMIYKDKLVESYRAVLGDDGKLYDPTYEVNLREEKILNHKLPMLSLSKEGVENNIHSRVSNLLMAMNFKMKDLLSDLFINQDKELTIILSFQGRPLNVFLGEDLWNMKYEKLEKIIDYLEKKKTFPSSINLANSKKIVVKF